MQFTRVEQPGFNMHAKLKKALSRLKVMNF